MLEVIRWDNLLGLARVNKRAGSNRCKRISVVI